jgi:hypothetical protein
MSATPDRLYIGGPDLSERLFGDRSPKNIRRIYRLNALPAGKRPKFFKTIGTQPAAFDSGIEAYKAETQD